MQIILQQTVPNLGLVGDVVEVAPGYYRNYLQPRKLAFLANPKSIRQVEHQKRIIDAQKIKQKDLAVSLKQRMEEKSLILAHQAGLGDKLFGSITSQEIVVGLNKLGFEVNRKFVQMEGPIKSLGHHTISVKLHPEVVAEIKVEVTKKETEEDKEKQAEKEAAKKEEKIKKKTKAKDESNQEGQVEEKKEAKEKRQTKTKEDEGEKKKPTKSKEEPKEKKTAVTKKS